MFKKIRNLIDLPGGVWMGLFTAAIIGRIVFVINGVVPLSPAEAAAYSTAIGAYALSRKGPRA